MASILELKERANKIFGNVSVEISIGDEQLLNILKDIANKEIREDEIELLSRTVDNIEKYFITKGKMKIKDKDYEYLKQLAEALRSQETRSADGVTESPIFEVPLDEENKEKHELITKDGLKTYVEAHTTTLKHLNREESKVVDGEDRRKINLFNIGKNDNLELARIIEIIKRNY